MYMNMSMFGLGRYEMNMTMFMYADTKTVKELNTKVDDWDAAKSTASELHQTLLKHAGDNAQESVTRTPSHTHTHACMCAHHPNTLWHETRKDSAGLEGKGFKGMSRVVGSWARDELHSGCDGLEWAMICRRT